MAGTGTVEAPEVEGGRDATIDDDGARDARPALASTAAATMSEGTDGAGVVTSTATVAATEDTGDSATTELEGTAGFHDGGVGTSRSASAPEAEAEAEGGAGGGSAAAADPKRDESKDGSSAGIAAKTSTAQPQPLSVATTAKPPVQSETAVAVEPPTLLSTSSVIAAAAPGSSDGGDGSGPIPTQKDKTTPSSLLSGKRKLEPPTPTPTPLQQQAASAEALASGLAPPPTKKAATMTSTMSPPQPLLSSSAGVGSSSRSSPAKPAAAAPGAKTLATSPSVAAATTTAPASQATASPVVAAGVAAEKRAVPGATSQPPTPQSTASSAPSAVQIRVVPALATTATATPKTSASPSPSHKSHAMVAPRQATRPVVSAPKPAVSKSAAATATPAATAAETGANDGAASSPNDGRGDASTFVGRPPLTATGEIVDEEVVRTVHHVQILLQTFGPLTYSQLENNLPPMGTPGTLRQILDLLLALGIIHVVDERATRESLHGPGASATETDDRGVEKNARLPVRYVFMRGEARLDQASFIQLFSSLEETDREIDRSVRRVRILRSELLKRASPPEIRNVKIKKKKNKTVNFGAANTNVKKKPNASCSQKGPSQKENGKKEEEEGGTYGDEEQRQRTASEVLQSLVDIGSNLRRDPVYAAALENVILEERKQQGK